MWMIRMEDVLNIVSKYCPDDDGSCSKAGVDLREMLDEIEGIPETEVQPVKHGQWYHDTEGYARCSICHEHEMNEIAFFFRYCPNCGARLDGNSE